MSRKDSSSDVLLEWTDINKYIYHEPSKCSMECCVKKDSLVQKQILHHCSGTIRSNNMLGLMGLSGRVAIV